MRAKRLVFTLPDLRENTLPVSRKKGHGKARSRPASPAHGLLTHLPHPKHLSEDYSFCKIPKREKEVFKASLFRIALRLVSWTYPLLYYCFYSVLDWVRGRRSGGQRGKTLRVVLENMGGIFVKVGQQLSTRLDLLPAETCQELSKLLDDMAPFPTEQALKVIERVTGRPSEEIFEAFDPEPIGSASVACVYYAILKTGEHVAVKVRRPNVGTVFAADLAALDLFCQVAEVLTIFRPGFTRAFRSELRSMFMEELDFSMEARYQELFRRQAKKDKQKYISAPRVFHEFSGHEVLVTEYVTGVWLTDLLAAKECNDQSALVHYERMNIVPKKVAKRLLRARHWSTFENLFYHADPHPANVVVHPENKLIFVDFGACGPSKQRDRHNNAALFRRQANKDVDGMVQVFNNILSPLPRLDLNEFTREGETRVAHWLYGFESKHSEWWEHTSADLWLQFFEATKEYKIPINADTVRLVRSSLLYDTIAARLYENINMQREFEKYEKDAQKRAVERALQCLCRSLTPGRIAYNLERVSDLGGRLFYKLQQYAHTPVVDFQAALNKASFVVMSLLQCTLFIGLATASSAVVVAIQNHIHGVSPEVGRTLGAILSSRWYWVAIIVLLLRFYRQVQAKLGDVDRQNKFD
jgi:predicted unusual protein kinase regulating ubiquinone biosynthesis (AarF/ABC1/UbiB family)